MAWEAPKLSYLKVWGCEAFVKRDTLTKPDKLDLRSFKSIFVGYPKKTMGYSFYSPSENKVFVARNAEFFESKLLDLKASGSVEDLELIQEEDTNPSVDISLDHKEDDQQIDEPQTDISPIHKSSRTRRAPDRMCLYIDTEEHELGDLSEPAKYKAALLDPESKKWVDAINVEMQSMKDNDNMTSRFQQNSGDEHWTAVKNILKYLRNTKDMFLVYEGNMERELRVSCYTDAGYLTDADNLKSQTRYVFVLNGGAVDWKSTKQSIFATSSTDAEYIIAFDASKVVVWIRKFIYGLGIFPTIEEPISMYCDNTRAKAIAKDDGVVVWIRKFIYGLGIVPTIEEPISMYCDNTRAKAIAKDDGVNKGARHFRAKVHYLRETIKF
nr:putative retrotransposon protein [Tanacetum cinerariifolium]